MSSVRVCFVPSHPRPFRSDAISNDPHVFEYPHEFRPERFMDSEFGTIPGKDENFRDNFAFGAGRVAIVFWTN